MIALLLSALLLTPQQPARDTPKTRASHGGVITGRVFATDGKTPLRRAVVRLSASTLPRRLTVRSDAQGRFTFTELPAGRFTLTGAKPGFLTLEYGQRRPFEPGRRIDLATGQRLQNVDVVLQPSGAISGTITDDSGEPVSQMWVFAGRRSFRNGRPELVKVGANAVTNDVGEFRISGLAPGDYYLLTRQRDARLQAGSDEPLGYGTTWYPGVTAVESAQPIRVGLGQHVNGLPFNVVATATATITGRVLLEGIAARGARVTVTDAANPLSIGDLIGGATVDEAGAFRIGGVRAGAYTLVADFGGSRGSADVHVHGNVSGITISIGRGTTIEGRLVSASGAPLPAASALQLRALLLSGNDLYGPEAARIAPDGTFTWSRLVGQRLLRATLPAGWWLKAVMRGDTDVTDTPIEFPNNLEVVRDVQFVLDNRPAELTGTVVSASGAAVADYTVVVFSQDAARWTPHSRHIRSDRPDHTGTFRIQGLPPGDYLAAAVEFVEDGRWLDPAFLESLRKHATKVAIDAQRPASVQLVLQGASQ